MLICKVRPLKLCMLLRGGLGETTRVCGGHDTLSFIVVLCCLNFKE